jgi:hypothetical protein
MIGYKLRPNNGLSKALLYIGLVVVVCMAGQFYFANRDALQLRAKVTDLEAQQISRLLTADEKATLITALSPFAGQKVSIWCLVSAWDCNAFAENFRSVFSEAKWNVPKIDFGTADYDLVGIEPILNERLITPPFFANTPPIPAAVALADTLYQLKLTQTRAINRLPDLPIDTILIRIGRIPQSNLRSVEVGSAAVVVQKSRITQHNSAAETVELFCFTSYVRNASDRASARRKPGSAIARSRDR